MMSTPSVGRLFCTSLRNEPLSDEEGVEELHISGTVEDIDRSVPEVKIDVQDEGLLDFSFLFNFARATAMLLK